MENGCSNFRVIVNKHFERVDLFVDSFDMLIVLNNFYCKMYLRNCNEHTFFYGSSEIDDDGKISN